MKSAFQAYLPPTIDELKSMWREALVSFDASVLLNVYRYPDKMREELLLVLEKLSSRVRLPHQFGLEFARNRAKVIAEEAIRCEKAIATLKDLKKLSQEPRGNPFLSPESIGGLDKVLEDVESRRKAIDDLISNDTHADRFAEIFKGRVSSSPQQAELHTMQQRARERYAISVPPGYMDKAKGEPECFGDCIGWFQLIEIVKTEAKGVIFVCDDSKEDWWEKAGGRKVGIRFALKEQLRVETGYPIHMYDFLQFLRYAKEYLADEVDISSELIEQASRQKQLEAEERRSASQKREQFDQPAQTDRNVKAAAPDPIKLNNFAVKAAASEDGYDEKAVPSPVTEKKS